MPDGSVSQETLNAETDPLSLVAEAHLREFDFLRREIELRLQERERMMTYFFLLAGTALASQVVFEQADDFHRALERTPLLYLIAGFALLWFPVETVMSFSYMRHMGRYINDVLSPKITAIGEATGSQTFFGNRFAEWQHENIPPEFQGQLRWEAYLKSARPYGYPYFGLSVFALMRTLILFGPSAFAVSQYIRSRLDVPLPELWLLVLELGLMASVFYIVVLAVVRTIGSR